MSKHTPGPWNTAGKGQALQDVIWAGTEYICELCSSERVPVGSEEQLANARLIAASPEMYDLLKNLYSTNRIVEYPEFWGQITQILTNIEGTDNG